MYLETVNDAIAMKISLCGLQFKTKTIASYSIPRKAGDEALRAALTLRAVKGRSIDYTWPVRLQNRKTIITRLANTTDFARAGSVDVSLATLVR